MTKAFKRPVGLRRRRGTPLQALFNKTGLLMRFVVAAAAGTGVVSSQAPEADIRDDAAFSAD